MVAHHAVSESYLRCSPYIDAADRESLDHLVMDITTLLSAVKPKERTDQYVILEALFALGAHTTPVTAKQTADILELHLGAKAPRT